MKPARALLEGGGQRLIGVRIRAAGEADVRLPEIVSRPLARLPNPLLDGSSALDTIGPCLLVPGLLP